MKFVLERPWELKGSYQGFWEFKRSMELNTEIKGIMPFIPAQVPGSVHWDLHQAGVLPNPYVGTQSLAGEWVNDRDWIYRTVFRIDPAWRHRRIRLVCEGIDYEARIKVNDHFIADHKGMFTPASIELDEAWLNMDGDNELLIVLRHTPEGVPQLGYTNKVDHLKSRFGYKWDFCPRLVHVGLWKPVYLDMTGEHRIADVQVISSCAANEWVADVHIQLDHAIGGRLEGQIELLDAEGHIVERRPFALQARPGLQQHKERIVIDHPQLWWPNGYGEQPLYQASVKVWPSDSAYSREDPSDERSTRFGLRALTFEQNPGAPADSAAFTIHVNGTPLFIKGWNWVPVDILYGRELTAEYQRLIALAKAAHINLLRVWGGGLIERELFYDLCDEAGILVWQEMMQSSSAFNNEPSTTLEYRELLRSTMTHVIKEKRNHPSLAIWCGGNELTRDGHLEDVLRPLNDEHPTLRMLRDLVGDLDPDRLFLATSPTGPSFFLSDETAGRGISYDVHGPWKYGGSKGHYSLYNKSDALLHSEYGGDGYASLSSLNTFLTELSWDSSKAESMEWLHHGYEFWNMDEQLALLFGPVEDMEARVQFSQWLQAEGLRYAVESNRRRAPRCSGSVLWQMNEPFPNIACTSCVDYYGDTKLAYHWVALAQQPVHASLQYEQIVYEPGETFEGECFAHMDLPVESCAVGWTLRDAEGRIHEEGRFACQTGTHPSQHVGRIVWAIPEGISCFFIRLTLTDEISKRVYSINEYAFAIRVGSARPELEAFRRLPQTELQWAREGQALSITNTGQTVALWVSAEASMLEGPPLRPLLDGQLIFPNETRQVRLPEASASEADAANWIAKGWNTRRAR
ncbi:hypothetical protein PA598K_02770 [Paenibacillus sp. 598K]|uniref:glycoside hydrolase family 2 protein n=1 Tax=Paenibacillus sp. 598K TaxID=1117987 RepID=UPI000FF900C8|nr:glycoside hydrolase family 2 TIM barrel-domain containing protein [Paenibacillus sp. 598K]GBF74427.1 hypothetical protein PA598K_02770 [Paenibacillus sp. 598K]